MIRDLLEVQSGLYFIRVFTINFIPSGQLLSFLCPFIVRFRERSANKPRLIFLSNYFCNYTPFFSSAFGICAEPRGGRTAAPWSRSSPCSCCPMSLDNSTGVVPACSGESSSAKYQPWAERGRSPSFPPDKPSLNLAQLEGIKPIPGWVVCASLPPAERPCSDWGYKSVFQQLSFPLVLSRRGGDGSGWRFKVCGILSLPGSVAINSVVDVIGVVRAKQKVFVFVAMHYVDRKICETLKNFWHIVN